MGFGIMIGMFGTGVMAVAVTGTIKTWTANEKLTASDLNTTISSLKTAIESIPNWTKNGTSAYYNDGNVGIGTNSPTEKLQVNGNLLVNGNITSQNTGQKIVAYASQSAGNPDYTWGGQTTTGMFLPASGQIGFSTGGTERIRINANGNVGIGTTSSSFPNLDSLHPLQVNITGDTRVRVGNDSKYIEQIKDAGGNNNNWLTSFGSTLFIIENQSGPLVFHAGSFEKMRIDSTGNVGIGTTGIPQKLTVNGNAGNTTGVWVNNSDIRLKKNIESLPSYTDKLLQLRPVSFEWRNPKSLNAKAGKHIGFIAQEVEKIFPNWVDTDGKGMKWLNMEGVNAVFVKSIQDIYIRIREMESQISNKNENISELESLKHELTSMKDENTKLKNENELINKQIAELKKENQKQLISFEERLKALEENRYAKK